MAKRFLGMHVGFSTTPPATSMFDIYKNLWEIIAIIGTPSCVQFDIIFIASCIVTECKECVCVASGDLIQLSDGPGGKSVSQSGGTVHKQPCGTCWTAEGQMGDDRNEQGHKRCQ